MSAVEVSTDPARLDRERVLRWITEESYWARGRAASTMDRAMAGSVVFGAYDDGGRQLGFARLVTDGATFGWLCDVFVDDAARGLGVGKALVAAVRAEAERCGLRRVMLATADAHGLYAQYGFRELAKPGLFMELPVDRTG
ncbi:GNAT family N-acetyltransferase [Mangrovactinospora gilvigrisea]|uniref:GNAT family N-acetyltransferase n=1 Tax=Mangrovactinospora gilvigrisea TaxID=1428644 RepID=A0A1J7C9N1_9ACTN|nr:GNAT family N-acetyltransferase [Mangrovactinospora gilvigrisea]OIV36354.1 GNAT family N-acetyltransferase [Mangrovactinospora gilvigrisea]